MLKNFKIKLSKGKYGNLIISLFAGILMGLSPAALNWWGLSWIAIAPLWLLVFNRQPKLKEAILTALVWGLGFHGVAIFWITGIHPMTWMGVPWLSSILIAIAVWVIISFWGAALVVCWAVLTKLITQRFFTKTKLLNASLCRVLIGVTVWCCLETIWSHSSLWWSSLSYTQSPNNLAILQLTKLSGFNTVTAAIVAVNGLIAEAIIQGQSGSQQLRTTTTKLALFLAPIALFVGLHLSGMWLESSPIVNDDLEALKVGIIQGNIPNEIKLYSSGWKKAIAGYTSGYQKLAQQGVDVVLTPETALPFFWNQITNQETSSFYRTVLATKLPIWVGAFGEAKPGYNNSLFTLTGDGKTYSRYDKSKLVPLGEYIPFEPILGKIIDRLSPLEAHLKAGASQQIFNTPFGQAIVGICYESAFAHHFRAQTKAGGEFIITASNNAHYGKAMPAQHHAQDVIRAIESDRWAARATNTGYSAIVDPHGRTLWQSEINQYQAHADTIYRRQTKTPYITWGDWLTPALLLLSFCLGICIIKNFL